MANCYTVVVSPNAAKMLNEHAFFLSLVNENAADRLIDKFEDMVNLLREMPERGPWFSQYPANGDLRYRKVSLSTRYLILYKVVADTVYINYVIDCRMNNQWLSK